MQHIQCRAAVRVSRSFIAAAAILVVAILENKIENAPDPAGDHGTFYDRIAQGGADGMPVDQRSIGDEPGM